MENRNSSSFERSEAKKEILRAVSRFTRFVDTLEVKEGTGMTKIAITLKDFCYKQAS